MRLVTISDTHDKHRDERFPEIPDGDILIHAGDATRKGTLESLNQLKLNGKLSSGESDTLQEAYRFFRKVEHALQYAHNRQVHTLPVKNSSVLHLAKRLSHSSASELMNKITEYRKSVRQIFENLLL